MHISSAIVVTPRRSRTYPMLNLINRLLFFITGGRGVPSALLQGPLQLQQILWLWLCL